MSANGKQGVSKYQWKDDRNAKLKWLTIISWRRHDYEVQLSLVEAGLRARLLLF